MLSRECHCDVCCVYSGSQELAANLPHPLGPLPNRGTRQEAAIVKLTHVQHASRSVRRVRFNYLETTRVPFKMTALRRAAASSRRPISPGSEVRRLVRLQTAVIASKQEQRSFRHLEQLDLAGTARSGGLRSAATPSRSRGGGGPRRPATTDLAG